MKLTFVSDSSILVEEVRPNSGVDLFNSVRELLSIHDHVNLHPAYESLLIDFDPTRITPAKFETEIRTLLQSPKSVKKETHIIQIPVIYGGAFGPDLEEAAKVTGLTTDELVNLHSSVEYTVSFLGFAPGFPYLSGLPKELALPRKSSPRLKVPAGSVAIGGDQTGIYPRESPGGWHLIGRTSIELFSPTDESPTKLFPGDRVRFVVDGESSVELARMGES